MQYEFAPLEGITGYIYRNAHHACFPSMDRYYTPFITPKKGKTSRRGSGTSIAADTIRTSRLFRKSGESRPKALQWLPGVKEQG